LKPIVLPLAFLPISVGATEVVDDFSPFSILSSDSSFVLCSWVRMAQNEVPVFRAGERNSKRMGLSARWAPAATVSLRVQGERQWVNWPDGTSKTGWGDLRLGTSGRLSEGGLGFFPALWVDWVVKLPNAQDESGLGTDETDAYLSLVALWEKGPWGAGLRGGLAIWGDPLQFANQDDAALFAIHFKHVGEHHKLSATLDWQKSSPRNAPRTSLLGGGQIKGLPGCLWAGVEGGVGLNPAAPDWQAGLLFGLDVPCRSE
jgi:hypothetical protein